MKPRVDVWLAGRTAGELAPAPRSIIDGSEAATVARVCCLGRYGLSRSVVSLPVGVAAAERFTRTCQTETIWRRRVFPAVLVAAVLLVVAYGVDSVRDDARHMVVTLLVALVLAVVVLAGRLALNLRRSPHHPREVKGDVYLRDVDREAVEIWIGLNPAGAIKIIDG
ncbi:hypothetical protein GCM10027186_10080 [Micromonospora schwarzwaldensis]